MSIFEGKVFQTEEVTEFKSDRQAMVTCFWGRSNHPQVENSRKVGSIYPCIFGA